MLIGGRMAENNIVNIDKRCKLGNRRVPNGTHGGLRGRMPGIMGILLLDPETGGSEHKKACGTLIYSMGDRAQLIAKSIKKSILVKNRFCY